MGYMTDGLTFNTLRQANLARLPGFKSAKGELTDHTQWSLTDWVCAVTGELGELANLVKKIRRGDFNVDEAREACAEELADVVTYLDILADKLGVDLGRATIAKFNKISERVDSPIRIREDGSDYRLEQPARAPAAPRGEDAM